MSFKTYPLPSAEIILETQQDTFEYRLDGIVNGVAVSSSATLVTIIGDTPASVPPPSSAVELVVAPSAYDDNYFTVGTAPVSMDICINDLPGTGGQQPFTVTLVTTPEAGGTLSTTGCTMTYTPPVGSTPPLVDWFRYTVTNEAGTSPAAIATIRIDAAPFDQSTRPDGGDTPNGNGGPVAVVDAVDDAYVLFKGTGTLSVLSTTGVLSNDRVPLGATVGSLLITTPLSIISGTANIGAASLVLSANGALFFTPDPSDTTGTTVYRATYTLTGSPGSAGTDSATITFTAQAQQSVAPVVAPLAADDSFVFAAGTAAATTFSPSILSNDVSRNSPAGTLSVNAASVSTVSPAGKGTVSVSSLGIVTFTPGTGANAPLAGDTLTFSLSFKFSVLELIKRKRRKWFLI